MNVFVGTSDRLITQYELRGLLNRLKSQSSYYCLRWPHQLGNFETELPDNFPSPEGQMFDENREIRWKEKGDKFTVLLLSILGAETGFKAVGDRWKVQTRPAFLHLSTETRFPKPITKPPSNIAQRYFIDSQTSTVHFVALTVKK